MIKCFCFLFCFRELANSNTIIEDALTDMLEYNIAPNLNPSNKLIHDFYNSFQKTFDWLRYWARRSSQFSEILPIIVKKKINSQKFMKKKSTLVEKNN